ncbi:MAG: ribonuclease HI family protein [Candidatus Micrarchaeia archaeon]
MENIIIYTDGASRSNPGKSASGYLIIENKKEISNYFYNGIKTNNEAEYIAVISALKYLLNNKKEKSSLKLYSDSEVIIKQLKGSYKVKGLNLIKLHEEALNYLKKFSSYELINVPRENKYISHVDRNLNRVLDEVEKAEKLKNKLKICFYF